MTIWFDLDGTISDLYGTPDWLEKLRTYDPAPYANAKPLVRMSALAKRLNNLQKMGFEIGIISWLSKCSTPKYDTAVTEAKYGWLRQHLPSVDWDEIHIVSYGTPKEIFKRTPSDVLFDDEVSNREQWGEWAYDVNSILADLEFLKDWAYWNV